VFLGPKGKPSNPGQQQMGDIVEAIKSGSFQLKKTTGPLQGEEKLAMMKRNDTDPAQNLAKMAQEVLLEKKRREREKAERAQAERASKFPSIPSFLLHDRSFFQCLVVFLTVIF
jgi:hypothetical protein